MGICVAMMHLAVKCTEQCFNNGLEQGLNMFKQWPAQVWRERVFILACKPGFKFFREAGLFVSKKHG